MKNQKGFTVAELLFVLVWLVGVSAYFWNAYKLSKCDFESNYKCEFVHAVGLIPLIHVATVWFDTDEK